jgi:hypothetical protein
MKVMLKACARCGGDLLRSRPDSETETLTCLQCGAERDLSPGDAWPDRYARPAGLVVNANDRRGEAA